MGDLDSEATHAAHSDEDREITFRQLAAKYRLIRGRDGVGYDRQGEEVEPGGIDFSIIEIGNRTQSHSRHA